MKTYEISLHYKQGDDFANILTSTKDIPAALRAWGKSFERCQAICDEVAHALDGKNVDVDADTHTISFTAKDATAAQVLAELARRDLLTECKF